MMASCGVWCLVLLTLSVGTSLSSAGPPGQNWGKYSVSCSYITYRLMLGGEEEEEEEEERERERERYLNLQG